MVAFCADDTDRSVGCQAIGIVSRAGDDRAPAHSRSQRVEHGGQHRVEALGNRQQHGVGGQVLVVGVATPQPGGAVDGDDVVRMWGLPVTRPARTWRDLAAVLPTAALLAVTDQLVDGYSSRAELEQALAVRPGGRGAARARAVLPLAESLSESPMESVLRWLMHEAGLPRPVLQHPVRNAAGAVLGRADFAWPDRKVVVEFDGDLHRRRDVFVSDLRRQNRFVAEGWIVLRFSSADVMGRPEKVIAAIRAALRL